MKTTSYGAWVKEYREGKEIWYPHGDTSFFPNEEDTIDLDFYVNGEFRNHFRLVSDGVLPYELDIWDENKVCYLSCAVVYTFNVWERMFTSKRAA